MQQATGCFRPGVWRPANSIAWDPTPPASDHWAEWCLRDPASTTEIVAYRSAGRQVRGGIEVAGATGNASHLPLPPPTPPHPRVREREESQVNKDREGKAGLKLIKYIRKNKQHTKTNEKQKQKHKQPTLDRSQQVTSHRSKSQSSELTGISPRSAPSAKWKPTGEKRKHTNTHHTPSQQKHTGRWQEDVTCVHAHEFHDTSYEVSTYC